VIVDGEINAASLSAGHRASIEGLRATLEERGCDRVVVKAARKRHRRNDAGRV
jgi:methylmalonyl-CoA mutase cobalamin-binding subunit